MLIDEVTLVIKAGNGGDGAVSFRRNAQTPKGGPDGGNGGNGGSIYVQGSTNIADLSQFRYKKSIKGHDGIPGKKNNLFGKNGEDSIISFPIGTRFTDVLSGQTFELVNDTDIVLLASGGKGGRGNNEFKSAVNQAPREFEKGEPGEEKTFKIELRLIADIGFVGYPNAGKSSLLATLTNAKPKIGNYPFTTLDPNLGIFDRITVADIPGIIAGASKGKGLGLQFLKHIEKTSCLVYCIDITDSDPLHTYQTLRGEFSAYNKDLLIKPELIVLTKIDLLDAKQLREKQKVFKDMTTVAVSIYQKDTIEELKKAILEKLSQ